MKKRNQNIHAFETVLFGDIRPELDYLLYHNIVNSIHYRIKYSNRYEIWKEIKFKYEKTQTK